MALPVRYHMIGLLFIGSVINYVDRVNISVAAPVMMKDLGWSKDQFGWVFSAFLIGYALLQIPGGVIADRWSGRKVLALAFCGFSLFTLLTPWGANAFFLLLSVRFLVGVFESMSFPATASINSRWIPRPEFGRAHTFSISGINAGQMIAYPLTTWIILHYDWQTVFYVNALFGLVWAAVWLWYAHDSPAAHPRVTQEEREYIESQIPPRPKNALPLRLVFTNLPVLTAAFGYMCYAYVGWMFLFWIPTYLVEARGYALGVMGMLGIPLQGSAFIGLVGGGMLGDWLLRRGWSPQFVRARMGGIGLALAIPFLIAAALVPSSTVCIACLILFYGLFHSALACYSTVAIEFNQHLAGAIFGLINTLGTFAGFLGPITAGYMLTGSDGNWLIPFFVAAAVAAASSLVLLTLPVRPIQVEGVSPAVVPVGGIVH
ncbi:MAG: MFS transporter [Deltaproteobacteria bacterium]|nr:MFS transporter [Deltaproteobacteria bacterium]